MYSVLYYYYYYQYCTAVPLAVCSEPNLLVFFL